MDDAEQNRSEQPTPFKLMRARERGTVARGMDLGFLSGLAAFLGYVWITGPSLGGAVAQSARKALIAAPNLLSSPNELLAVTGMLFAGVARPLAVMTAVIFLIVCLFEIVQTGVIFTMAPLKPDFGRLNPGKGLKRLFSLRLLIETFKNVLKLALYATIAFFVIRHALAETIASITGAGSLLDAMAKTGFRMLVYFLIVALFFAVIDQFIVRRDFLKKMRMSRREVRRELRDREGDPRLKQRRKQLHAEFVKASQSLRGIRGSDVVITNPTHYAVALRYDPALMAAPKIVSLGSNRLAMRLKKLAFVYGVVIVQDRALARELFHKSQLNREIPEACYRRIADIYLAIRDKAKQGATG